MKKLICGGIIILTISLIGIVSAALEIADKKFDIIDFTLDVGNFDSRGKDLVDNTITPIKVVLDNGLTISVYPNREEVLYKQEPGSLLKILK